MKFQYGTKTKHPLYWVWRGVLLRCSSKHKTYFHNYRARGVAVCQRWKIFENFLSDMGPRPEGFTLDRINNDGDYEPTNCRWADRVTQSRNRRYARPITHNGKTQLLSDWAKELSVNPSTISMRIDKYKWPIERALRRNYHAV